MLLSIDKTTIESLGKPFGLNRTDRWFCKFLSYAHPGHLLKSFVVLVAVLSTSSSYCESLPERFSLKGTLFETVALNLDMDPLLLYALAITESATGAGNGNIRPYPYVFRSSDGPRYFKNKDEAAAELSDLLKRTQDIDVGMLQINLRFHPQHNPSDLLDPYYNLTAGANYLKAMMATTTDPVIGVGRYHSWTDERAQWYGQTVWQTYKNILQIGAFQGSL